jgi:hypothetical protein
MKVKDLLSHFFWFNGFWTEAQNKESPIEGCTLSTIGDDQWPVRPLGKNYSAEAWGHCMKVWSMLVQRELNNLPECLLVCNLVVMEWTAAITDDHVGLLRDFSLRRKILENSF